MRRRRKKRADNIWRTCRATGKRSYRTEEAAETALANASRVRSTHKHEHRERRIYECDYCGGWHLTSQEFRRFDDFTGGQVA